MTRRCVFSLVAALLLVGLGTGCSQKLDPPVQDDLRDASFDLVTQDSSSVTFPDAYRGDVLVVGYIYTQCPDVCPMITANMKNVRSKLDSTEGVRFVTITFDPERDTPDRLAAYRDAYKIDAPTWAFLTGSPETVDRLMNRLGIRTTRTPTDPSAPGDTTDTYFINHTDQITLIDAQGRIRGEYMGSRTPPKYIVEDIHKLRS
jgi:protein SCO1/2